MADKKTRADLEILFSSGKIPTQSNFADLIASGVSQKDDGLQKASDTPLKIQAPVSVETDAKTPKDLILFYEKIDDAAAKWKIGSRLGGLEISRGAQTDFLIDANGNVGIGTTKPLSELSISSVKAQANSPEQRIGELTFTGFDRNAASASILAQSPGWDDQSHLIFKTSDSPTGANERMRITNQGSIGVGTSLPKAKLHVIASGDFGTEMPDGMALPGNVPIVAQSNKTAFGIINGSGRPAFALDIKDDAGTKTGRGVPVFLDKYDGEWHSSLHLKNGKVGIGTVDPQQRLSIWGGIGFADQNDKDKKLYSPVDGVLEWMTQDGAVQHGFAVSRNGEQQIFLNTNGNSYLKGGNVGIGTTDIKARLHVVGGAIMPAEGNSESAGILFPPDAFGGSSDRAYIRWYARSAESTTLEIGNQDNTDDHISLMPAGGVGIGTNDPQAKLDVRGTAVFDGKITSKMWRVTKLFANQSGSLPIEKDFSSGGGLLLLFVSGTGFRTGGGNFSLIMKIDGANDKSVEVCTNEGSSHKAFPMMMETITGLAAGNHTFRLENGGNAITDINDRFYVTIIEFPF